MKGQLLLVELIEFMEEKNAQMDKSIHLYANLDETVNQAMLTQVVEQIDKYKESIQALDIRFVAKLDRFKQMNAITSLDELSIEVQEVRNLFKKLKSLIAATHEKEILLREYTQTYGSKDYLIDKGKVKAISAYKNINK